MEDDFRSRAFRIASPEAAKIFLDPKRRRILALFLGRERSLAEAGRALAMPLNRLSHHVGTFLRLGLLVMVRAQKRAGRPIRYYRACADAFRVPAGLMRERAGDALAQELRAGWQSEAISGRRPALHLDERGAPDERSASEAESEACEYWRVLTLTRAKPELAHSLAGLLRDYEDRPARGSAAMIHVAFAPRLTR